MAGGKRFAVLLCAEESEYITKKYGGYFVVFARMLVEEAQTWDAYRAVANEFLDNGETGNYNGFVITGSCIDADGNGVSICKLLNLLKKLDSLKKRVLSEFALVTRYWAVRLVEKRAGFSWAGTLESEQSIYRPHLRNYSHPSKFLLYFPSSNATAMRQVV
ncbi:hypothetical protein Nepgr_018244 [Nepenthes gracilis]|uniref:Uncharacterized protein n=1 Tax=Nepenthes gracilis TaxID=150966 RepID=A0AAD3SRX3_NEPGR|nr:hypothetical protein Nepgr_018244 [Nepenthes gracilis]